MHLVISIRRIAVVLLLLICAFIQRVRHRGLYRWIFHDASMNHSTLHMICHIDDYIVSYYLFDVSFVYV